MDDHTLLARYKKLDPFNRRVYEEWLRKQRLQNISEETMLTKLWKVYGYLIWSGFKPICTTRPEDTENFYLERRSTKSPHTAFGDIQELKTFFKWLLPGKDLFKFTPQRPRTDIDPEKILDSSNARQLVGVCENHRDVTLIVTFWDSGGRLDELLSANIGDVKFDKYGAIINVDGKTGRRNIRLVNSVPDLQTWLNRFHPLKQDMTAPLFVTLRKRGSSDFTRMNKRTVQNLFKRLGELAGCQKKTNPHAFRHGRATSRAPKMTEPEMREYFGWSKGSHMPSVYVHLSSRDIDDKILAIEGVKKEEVPAPDPMAVVPCPRCNRPNSPDAMFCGVCLMALNDSGLQYIEKMRVVDDDPDFLDKYSAEKRRKT